MSFKFNPFTDNLDLVGTGGSGGSGVQTLTGDTGGPVSPIANNINIQGGASGAILFNGAPGALNAQVQVDNLSISISGSDKLQVNNYSNQTTTTANAIPDNAMKIPLGGVPGVYTFDINVSAFNTTDTLGAGYSIFGTVRTDGAAGTVIGTPDVIDNREGAMIASNVDLVAIGNNAVISVTGLNLKTINWRAIVFYTLVT